MALDSVVGADRHQSELTGPVRLAGRIERAATQVGMRRDVVPGKEGDAEVVDLHGFPFYSAASVTCAQNDGADTIDGTAVRSAPRKIAKRRDSMAVAGNAERIVTGNVRDLAAGELLFEGFSVVTPGQWLREED